LRSCDLASSAEIDTSCGSAIMSREQWPSCDFVIEKQSVTEGINCCWNRLRSCLVDLPRGI
jgi:hypothetical protein